MFTVNQKDLITTISLKHGKGNPFNLQVVQAFFEKLNELPEDTKVLILEGNPHFSVGMDLYALSGMNAAAVESLFSVYEQLLYRIETSPYIVIAKITGYAMGAGAELALACDFRIMEQKSKMGFPGVNVGFAYNTKRLQRFMTKQLAKKIVLTGTSLSAHEALQMGIVDEVATKATLDQRVEQFAASFLGKSPHAIRYTKAAFLDMDPQRAMTLSISAGDYKEGSLAFVEKRKPRW